MTTQKKNAIAKRQWWRMDLHLHTMASADWKEPGVGWLDWLYRCEQRGLDIVAITDHNTVAGIASLRKEIERLGWLEADNRLRPNERRALDEYRRLGNDILVLPGFEITATFGADGVLSGSAGCNHYRAAYVTQGSSITIQAPAATRKTCPRPDGVMRQESEYLKALPTAATYTIQGRQLELRTAEDALVALFQASGG